jgi:ABC-type glycerol-3-phosphate transport system permease component
MAASAMFTVPTVVLFLFAQQTFIEGIVTTGLKG